MFPTSALSFTSLKEARVELQNNQFEALIIIPPDFSQNVENLNKMQTQIALEFDISELLSGVEQRDILYTVLRLGGILNTNLSYII